MTQAGNLYKLQSFTCTSGWMKSEATNELVFHAMMDGKRLQSFDTRNWNFEVKEKSWKTSFDVFRKNSICFVTVSAVCAGQEMKWKLFESFSFFDDFGVVHMKRQTQKTQKLEEFLDSFNIKTFCLSVCRPQES